MTRNAILSLAGAAVLALGMAATAQAEGGGGGGGDDRWAQPAQAPHLNRGRDAARSTVRGGSTQSVAAEHGYRDVTVTRSGRSTTHRAGGPATASAEWKDDKGNVVRWNPKRARQADFAESRERRVTTRSEADGAGGRNVTTTRGGRAQTQPSIYDNKSWIR